jgi:2-hydroxychromene-2-carboxylate isomerase
MERTFEYWFDFSCPYAYLASTQVEALAERTGATLHPKPLLLGGVFRALETPQNLAAALGVEKAKHNLNDMRRFAQLYGVPLSMPANHPLRTVDALRAYLAASDGRPAMPLAHRFFRAYWVDGIDLSREEGVRAVLTGAGLDASAILAKAASPELKDDLRRRTDEAIARGVFGVPAFFASGELFWGQDRIDFVEEALGGRPRTIAPSGPLRPVDFWFDYSSPFSYIASERVERVLGRAVRWRPMLLGGVFKALGTENVPLFGQNPSKRRHTDADMRRQADRAGAPFLWPSRFPMNTVLPLRVTLLAGGAGEVLPDLPVLRDLVHLFFRAFWSEDQDISSPDVVARIAGAAGFDGPDLVRRASEPEGKELLRRATEQALAAGVFGAPTFIADVAAEQRPLYWGADRLDLAARAAGGDARVI